MRGECHVSCRRGPRSSSFRSEMMVSLERVVLVLAIFVGVANGLRFHLAPNGRKCIKENVHKGVVVAGEYEAADAPADQKMDVVVTDSKGHTLVNHHDKLKSRFSFSSDESDDFEMCFTSRVPVGVHATNREVTLDVKHGVETKNYDALAESAKLKPLEVELKKLEDLSEAIVSDFAYMRKREEEMRDTNESTNKRVLFLSVFSMLCLFSLATWQVLYLRRYFKAKKLIE